MVARRGRGPRRDRRHQSLRQEYQEFLLQRIEEFKDQLSREQLLAMADEAVQELDAGSEDQLVLTEVLVLEHVDRMIMRRLNLPSFRRWRDRHVKLRRAQREPTHWGLASGTPLAAAAVRLGDGCVALVAGRQASGAAFYLAAYEWPVLFIDQDVSVVESVEARAAAESLAMRFQALVVAPGCWFPDVSPDLAVLDRSLLGRLDHDRRTRFLDALRSHTNPGGRHCVLPGADDPGPSLEALRQDYAGWETDVDDRRGWFLAVKP